MNVKELVTVLGFKPDEASLRRAEKSMARAGKRMQKVGRRMSVGMSLPMLALGIGFIKVSTNFNESMANIASLIPGNIERVNELKRAVQEMAIETGKSTDDLAGGLYQIISAFGDSAEAVEILRLNTRLAVAGVASTAEAINLTSAVTKAYGNTSAEAVLHVSDLASETVRLGQTTIPELSASMQGVTALAVKFGVSQEELFASYATLTGVTGATAEVGTQMSGMLSALMKPTSAMTKAIKALGFAGAEQMVQNLGLVGSYKALIGGTDGSTEAIGRLIARKEGAIAVMALTGEQHDDYIEKSMEMADVTGATNRAYDAQTKGVNKAGFALNQLQQRVVVMSQRMGDALAPALLDVMAEMEPLVQWVERMVDWFNKASPATQKWITAIGALVAGLGPLIMAIGALNVVMAANPIGLIVIAIAALVVGFITLWNTSEGFRNFAKTIWNGFIDGLNLAIKGLNFLIDIINKIPGIDIPNIERLEKAALGYTQKEGEELAWAPGQSPGALKLAEAGTGGAGGTTKNSTVSFSNFVEIHAPPGTSSEELESIIDEKLSDNNDKMSRQLTSNNREIE